MASTSSTGSASSANIVGLLGGGSGIDIKTLAQNLVEAEKAPKADAINARIKKSEARISGYATISYAVSQLQKALEALKNPSDFNTYSTASSLPASVAARVTGLATQGTHEVKVTSLATSQRSVSKAFGVGEALNGTPAVSFNINLTMAGSSTPTVINVTDPTPQGVVSAINNASTSVKATLINKGQGDKPLYIMLQGPSGSTSGFSLTTDPSTVDLGFDFSDTALQTSPNRKASDADFTVDGIQVYRSTNQVSDVLEGVTLDLLSSSGTSSSTITLSRDSAPIKDKIKAVVASYNDLQAIIDSAMDRDSQVENLGGTLVGDTVARGIRSMVKRIVMPDSARTTDTTAPIVGLRQLGLFIDSDNQMKFTTLKDTASAGESLLNVGDESTLDKMLAERFADVATFFSGSGAAVGQAKDMAERLSGTGAHIDSSVRPESPIRLLSVQQRNADRDKTTSLDRLKALDDRMSMLLTRYIQQFAVMDKLVGESKSTRSGVENSFKGMSAQR